MLLAVTGPRQYEIPLNSRSFQDLIKMEAESPMELLLKTTREHSVIHKMVLK